MQIITCLAADLSAKTVVGGKNIVVDVLLELCMSYCHAIENVVAFNLFLPFINAFNLKKRKVVISMNLVG